MTCFKNSDNGTCSYDSSKMYDKRVNLMLKVLSFLFGECFSRYDLYMYVLTCSVCQRECQVMFMTDARNEI